MGAVVLTGARAGVFRVYEDVSRHGLAYALVTPVILIVLQDAYFYVTHRAMHHRWLFRAVHLEHHLSRHTSPFTAYAFSPVEALVHAAFVPLVTLVMPAHQLALFAFLGFMIVRNVLGHLAIEIFPAKFLEGPLRRLSTTTTHHALHHLRPNTNFGLYFPHWDDLLGTTDPQYRARFAAVTEGAREDVRGSAPLGVRSP
jgi:sterol desaturase/sphingolipid hydroxylase (fatty acid hydroxylase superfamily)